MKRGEVWLVDFNPTRGAEIQKIRPAVIISSDAVGKLPLRIIVPLTGWKATFDRLPWMIPVQPTPGSGLTKKSAADAFQVRSVSTARLVKRLGALSDAIMTAIAAGVAICIEYR